MEQIPYPAKAPVANLLRLVDTCHSNSCVKPSIASGIQQTAYTLMFFLQTAYIGTARIYPTRTPVQRAHSGNFLPFQ